VWAPCRDLRDDTIGTSARSGDGPNSPPALSLLRGAWSVREVGEKCAVEAERSRDSVRFHRAEEVRQGSPGLVAGSPEQQAGCACATHGRDVESLRHAGHVQLELTGGARTEQKRERLL